MNEQKMLKDVVRQWEADGKWSDRGRWRRTKRGVLEYVPTKREISAKCRLLRTVANWRGAHKRAPRGGEFSVLATAGF